MEFVGICKFMRAKTANFIALALCMLSDVGHVAITDCFKLEVFFFTFILVNNF